MVEETSPAPSSASSNRAFSRKVPTARANLETGLEEVADRRAPYPPCGPGHQDPAATHG